MLARRSLELRPDGQGLSQPYIARETLVDCARAQVVLEQAQAQAGQLLERANAEADATVLEAQAQFWEKAETLLAAWDTQRPSHVGGSGSRAVLHIWSTRPWGRC